jgi:hypothetical protein
MMRFLRRWWFVSTLVVLGSGGIYFWFLMERALETQPAKLVKLYDLAKQRDFDQLERGQEEAHSIFRVFDKENGPVQSFKVTGIELWLPIWGEIYGVVYRRGVPYRVEAALENDVVTYVSENKDRIHRR